MNTVMCLKRGETSTECTETLKISVFDFGEIQSFKSNQEFIHSQWVVCVYKWIMGLVTNEQNNYKCYITGKHLHHRPPPPRFLFPLLWKHTAALVGLSNFLKEHEILQSNVKSNELFYSTTHHIFQNQLCSSRLGTYDEEAGAH